MRATWPRVGKTNQDLRCEPLPRMEGPIPSRLPSFFLLSFLQLHLSSIHPSPLPSVVPCFASSFAENRPRPLVVALRTSATVAPFVSTPVLSSSSQVT